MNQPATRHTIPFSVAVLGIATFSGMDAFMKSLSIEIGAYNAMLWRTLISIMVVSVLFFWRRERWPDQQTLKLHVWRGAIISVMAYLFFWGLIYVPLAEAIGLSFIAPLLALYLAAVILGETLGRRAVTVSIIGFVGALIIVSGKMSGDYGDDIGKGIAAILLSAVLYAYNLILQRQQALAASPLEIAFFQNSTVFIIYLCFAPALAVTPSINLVPELGAAAALGIISTLLLSWAYARAPANILIPVEYTAFIWATLFGWLVFSEAVTLITLAGTALIVAACLAAAKERQNQVDHVETTAL